MIIKYTGKTISDLASEEIRHRIAKSGNFSDLSSHLIVGREYKVFALSRWGDGGMRAYVHSLEECSFPSPYPLELFEIVDSLISKDWVANSISNSTEENSLVISFREWALDETFYERLVDGDLEFTAIYKKYFADSR